MSDTTLQRGLTPREFARLYRVSRGRVVAMIRTGELPAIDVASRPGGRPQYRIMPHHVAAWERGRAAAVPARPRRRRRAVGWVDYYADSPRGGNGEGEALVQPEKRSASVP